MKWNGTVILFSGVGGGGAGGGSKGTLRRVEELQTKVMRQSDELVEMHRKRSEVQTQLTELTTQLRRKEEDLSKKDDRLGYAALTLSTLHCINPFHSGWQDPGAEWEVPEAGGGGGDHSEGPRQSPADQPGSDGRAPCPAADLHCA